MAQLTLKRLSWKPAGVFSWQDTGLTCAAILALILILAAHLVGGADAPAQTSLFVLLYLALASFLFIMTRFEAVPIPGLVFAAMITVAVVLGLTGNWYQARTEMLQLAGAVAIWSTAYMAARSKLRLETLWLALQVTAIAAGVLGFLGYAVAGTSGGTLGMLRMRSTFDSANVLASLVGLASILSFSHLLYLYHFRSPNDVPRLARFNLMPRTAFISATVLFLSLACLILTLSRTGIVLTLSLLIIALFRMPRRSSEGDDTAETPVAPWLKLARSNWPALIVVAIAISALAVGPLAHRISLLDSDSIDRWALFSDYWAAWQEAPLFGHGLGSFPRVNEAITDPDNAARLVLLGAAHNVVLQWLIQTGLVGFLMMASVWGWMHYRMISGLNRHAAGLRVCLLYAILGCSAFLITHNMVDFSLEVPSIMWLYAFLLGLGCGINAKGARITV